MVFEDNITTDAFFNGKVKINQLANGYRFSIDAVLLAALPRPKTGQIVLDIGTGCGIVPILMAFRNPDIRFYGIELQADLASIAKKNVLVNQMQDRITILNEDVRCLKIEKIKGPVDWITVNPPYRSAHSGRINPNRERAIARHEIFINLHELIMVCRQLLRTGGQFTAIYPIERLVDLFHEMRVAGIEPKWIQSVHSKNGEEAKLVLVKGRMRGNPGMRVAQPLFIYGKDGEYTHAIRQMMAPSFSLGH